MPHLSANLPRPTRRLPGALACSAPSPCTDDGYGSQLEASTQALAPAQEVQPEAPAASATFRPFRASSARRPQPYEETMVAALAEVGTAAAVETAVAPAATAAAAGAAAAPPRV